MNSRGLSRPVTNKLGVAIATAKRYGKVPPFKPQIKSQLKAWSRVFLSTGCAVCDRPTSHTFCLDCQRQLPAISRTTSPAVTDAAITGNAAATHAVQGWYKDETHSLPVGALGLYSGTLKRAILAMKYNHRPDVAGILGHQLGQQWPQTHPSFLTPSAIYAVPVPLHRQRRSQRGYNQAELIARAFCKTSGLPLLADGLERTQATVPQHQLSLIERQKNLAEAFYPGKALQRICRNAQRKTTQTPGPAAIIIDDIYTTGTTARNAAKTLTEAGMPVLGILAIARAML